MDKQKNIVVIGGNACGPKAAARARRLSPGDKITMIEQGDYVSTATCGLPYYVSGAISKQSDLFVQGPGYFRRILNIEVMTHTRALSIDPRGHRVELTDLKTNQMSTLDYDKLVLATGSTPIVLDIKGSNLKNIHTMTKVADAEATRNILTPDGKIKSAVIIGAGLIGLEMAEALTARGLSVTIIEALDKILPAMLDFEMAAYVARHLEKKGVKMLLGQRVSGFEGNENGEVHKAVTQNAEIDADLVILSIGTRPNTALAKASGLEIGKTGGIAVNRLMQTSDPDIYAGGDCVEVENRVTGQKMLVPLGSTANKHGRVIGTNIGGGHEEFPGVTGTGIVKVFDCNVGRTGLSETQAHQAGFDVVTCLAPGTDHAGFYPSSKEILIKMVAEAPGGRILGGQAVGEGDISKRIDVLATALSFGAKADDIANLDLAYAPQFNSAFDPLHNAANVIRNKLSGLARSVTPMEVKKKMDDREDFIFLDVRTNPEWNTGRIDVPQVKWLPVHELREKLNTLPKDAEIIVTCASSVRAYQAQRILDSAGFTNVKFMDGSLIAWPYEITGKR
jgi:NADPH-dependent 2,4-dienoyl-CoA reductase/sulfur reductase-like enzyme/rhodanese-related sulfurtransferase